MFLGTAVEEQQLADVALDLGGRGRRHVLAKAIDPRTVQDDARVNLGIKQKGNVVKLGPRHLGHTTCERHLFHEVWQTQRHFGQQLREALENVAGGAPGTARRRRPAEERRQIERRSWNTQN